MPRTKYSEIKQQAKNLQTINNIMVDQIDTLEHEFQLEIRKVQGQYQQLMAEIENVHNVINENLCECPEDVIEAVMKLVKRADDFTNAQSA